VVAVLLFRRLAVQRIRVPSVFGGGAGGGGGGNGAGLGADTTQADNRVAMEAMTAADRAARRIVWVRFIIVRCSIGFVRVLLAKR